MNFVKREGMYKSVSFYASFGDRTGYQIHATELCNALEKLIPVYRNQPGGEVSISLIDSVSIQNINERLSYPSILWNVWEASEQPQWFIDRLKYFDQLWVPSEWQRACSIAQGIPEEFVKVVPEGVNPDIFKPMDNITKSDTFDFLVVGQWQPRKSTLEIVRSFTKAFTDNKDVRLYLSVDTLFPSDTHKSTEERLLANGISDDRIIPVHFEERENYVKRLQSIHCHVSCARAEGFGLPICESMAVGTPTIVCDYSGSTEYAQDAIKVPVSKMIEPFGIYGDWKVPGLWCEPDYDVLVSQMQDVYNNYSIHKEKALKTSEYIRTKFSWDEAAKTTHNILEEFSKKENISMVLEPESAIKSYARSLGYEITNMKPFKAIFIVDSHPTSQDRMDTLLETINQLKVYGYPILLTSHCVLPPPIIELADYYIYDKKDITSGDDKPTYFRTKLDGTTETTIASIPCHALAWLHNIRNAIDFCLGKYDWIYQMSSDVEVDIEDWLSRVSASDKSFIGSRWENQEGTLTGQLIAGKVEIMDKLYPRLSTWEEFATMYGDDRFCCEKGQYKRIDDIIGIENVEFLSIDLGNRFDQVDRDAWKDEEFQCHFIDGPFLNIVGMSNREYDVIYSNPIDGDNYNLKQKPGMWSRPSKKYYRDWTIKALLDGEIKFERKINLSGQNVIVSMGSKALGDTLAWIPYVEEFRKKHNCNVYCSTWWNNILDYPDINFVKPGDTIESIHASYEVGCFDNQLDKNVKNWRETPLQKVSSDILGLDYEPIKAKLKYKPYKSGNGKETKPYICFSEFSTMQNKLWNRPGAWQKVIDYLNSLGYDCISVSVEPSQLSGIIKHNGQSIEQTLTDISGCEFYIGLNAGPTWLAYSLNKPCIMITGVSQQWNDFPNLYRIAINEKVCGIGCFNDPSLPISRDWEWCPRNKNYVCTKEITEKMVIGQIDKITKKKRKKKHKKAERINEVMQYAT